jgi:hypothetical protein
MSIASCVAKLVEAGTLDRKTADQALDMHKRMKGEFTRELPPASAEAAAALATAKALRDGAAQKLRNVAAMAETFQQGETRLAEHPMGRMAGLAGMITRDLWRDAPAFRDLPAESLVKQGANVEGKYKAVVGQLYQKFALAMKEFRPGFTGANSAQMTGVDNLIRENFGQATGDSVAKDASTGWMAAAKYAEERAKQGGKIFSPIDDWRQPQFWRGTRVKSIGQDQFTKDIGEWEQKGGFTIWDRDTGKPVAAKDRDFVVKRAYEDMTQAGGASAPFSKEQRTFQFAQGKAGADAYLALMKKYGPGTNIMQMLVGHLDRMAREIALTETFGPNYEANFRALFKQARANPTIPAVAGAEKWNPARLLTKLLESKGAVEGAWKVATGAAHPTHDDFMTGMLGAMRNMNVASSLRQAVFSVLPTDSVTQLLASNHLGMDGIGHMARVFGGGVSKDDAAHLNIAAHNVMDYVNGIRDYDDHVSLMQTTGKFAAGTVKATGLEAWGNVGKRTWAGDMLNLFAKQSDTEFGKLEPAFKNFLDSYGFTERDWNKLRAADKIDLSGARYLNPNALQTADRTLYERVMNAIQEQGAFAMHQPDFRLRGIETGAAYGAGPGKAMELWRSFFQFKTFALSRMSTQMMRVLTDGPIENRIMRGLAFVSLATAAGAASNQALQIINGKDPARMDTAAFWAKAVGKGGAAGYYADLLDAAMRGGGSAGDVLGALGGPVVGMMSDATKLATSPIREEFNQDQKYHQSTLGRSVISVAKRNTPNTWYTRLAVDRLLWDKLQTLVDPDYRKSWSRTDRNMQRGEGNAFFWPQGESAPTRAPNFGTAIGQ